MEVEDVARVRVRLCGHFGPDRAGRGGENGREGEEHPSILRR